MIEQNLAIVSAVRKVILEDLLATKSNVPSKLLPTGQPGEERIIECLCKKRKEGELIQESMPGLMWNVLCSV